MSQERIGARQLAELNRDLTDRDRAVLTSVAVHRFLTTTQIARLHFHDHQTPSAGMRACTRVLGRLRHHRLLDRLDRRIGGVGHGSASFVWHLDVAGQRLHQRTTGHRARQRLGTPSAEFLEHTLAIAEIHLSLIEADRAGRIELVDVQLEPDCWRTYTRPHGDTATLRPDLAVVTGSGEWEDHWYLEVDRGTEPLTRLVAKCAQYAAYRATGAEDARLGVFPAVVWILPTPAREAAFHRVLAGYPELDADLFHTTTPDRLVDLIAAGPNPETTA